LLLGVFFNNQTLWLNYIWSRPSPWIVNKYQFLKHIVWPWPHFPRPDRNRSNIFVDQNIFLEKISVKRCGECSRFIYW